MSRPADCAAERLRHRRPLRGDDEGRDARHLSRGGAGRHHPRRPAARRAHRRARSSPRPTATSQPARCSWPWSIRALARAGAASPSRPPTTASSPPTTACSAPCSTRRRPGGWSSSTERKFARATISRTFEGRDRFAPAAAWLAKGAAITTMGRSVAAPVRLEWPAVVRARRRARRRGRDRRSLRQPRHQRGPRCRRAAGARPAGSTSRLPAARCRDWSPPTPTSPRENCARSSEAATISRSPSAAAAPRAASGVGVGAPVRLTPAGPVIRWAVRL